MIKLERVNKYFYRHKKNQIHVINNTSVTLGDNGLVALLGPSGCGKTTLLNAIGGLDKINSGKIYINGKKIAKRRMSKVDKIRNLNIGYIFQDYLLVDDMTVFDNVALALKISGIKNKEEIKKRVNYVLEKVHMYRYRNRYANMLSGGERQRVGIARAIVKNPSIIIADEPTGNLDSKNTIEVMNIIKAISKDRLVILVTHETELADFYASRILRIEDGTIVSDEENNHTNDLDYRLDNKIYLKDFEYQNSYGNNDIKVNYYSNDNKKLEINLIVQNGNIYIESKNNQKIEVVDSNSSIEVVDDHYKKLSKSIYEEYNFDLDKISNKNIKRRYTSIFNPISLIINGFRKVRDYSIIKKILLIGFFVSAMFIAYSVSSYFGIYQVNEKKFVNINPSYLTIVSKKIKVNDYLEYEKDENIDYVLPGDSSVTFMLKFDDYYQSRGDVSNINGSLSSKNMISDSDIISGRMIETDKEIIIDKRVFELYYESTNAKYLGINKPEELFDRELFIGSLRGYKIVGVVDKNSPSIYMDESNFVNILANNDVETQSYMFGYNDTNDKSRVFDYNLYDIKIKKGRLPKNDYEVIISNDYKDTIKLNKTIDYKVNGKKLKVVGYYTNKDKYDLYLTNNNTVKYELINKSSDLIFYAKDTNLVLNKYREKGINIKDSYEYSKELYMKDRIESFKSSLILGIIILSISLLEIYLMIRSSFLSRIKEVGIYRAIGVKKRDIYKMFTGEIIAITTIASLLGIIFMSYILKELSTINYISDRYVVNINTFVITVVFVYIFNLFVGLLPVYRTLRKSPARILSRSDI